MDLGRAAAGGGGLQEGEHDGRDRARPDDRFRGHRPACLFRAFDAALVDREGNIQVGSDKMRQLLEYAQKLVKLLPADAVSFDDASNNRALISGKSALIFNPPSAWAVAKRDAPQVAADCWTFPAPAGPEGRFEPYLPYFWGVWKFSQNKSAAKELIAYLSERPQVEERCNVVIGYDLPPFDSMLDFKVWEEVEPPQGYASTTTRREPFQRRQAAHRRLGGVAGSRGANLQPRHHADHAGEAAERPVHQGRDRLGEDELEGFMR